jgi:hypothetical protein
MIKDELAPIHRLLSFDQHKPSTTHISIQSMEKVKSVTIEEEMIPWTPPSKKISTTNSGESKKSVDIVCLMDNPLVQTISPSTSPNSTGTSPVCKVHNNNNNLPAKVENLNDLVRVMNTLYAEQQRINDVNMQLNCVNLFANFGNFMHVKRLTHKCKAIGDELQTEKIRVSELHTTVESQNKELGNLKNDLDGHKLELKRSNEKYYKSITELNSTLSHHQQLLEKWERIRLKEDFALDILFFILSLFVVNTRIISFSLHAVSSGLLLKSLKAGNYSVRVKALRMTLKFIFLLIMVFYARNWAIRNEFHASATIYQYLSQLLINRWLKWW